MKTTPSQKIRLGLFTIVGILLLIGAIYYIGKQKNMFGETFRVHGIFKNVGGLQVGNNVRFVGINVGTVVNISILTDSTAEVDMRLEDNVKPFLKANAIASIGSDGLMGDKLVSISAGTDNADLMKSGGRIATVEPPQMDKIIGKFSEVVTNAEVITNSLAGISTQVSHGKGSIGQLLYSDKLEKGLEGTVNSAQQTMQSLKKGTEGFSENMDAAKHSFLLKGYFKKKAKHQRDSIANLNK
ncbi:MAG: MlaD family protein [Mucilaginibacter sp.]